MEVKTLDQQLRERGAKKLSDRLHRSFELLRTSLREGGESAEWADTGLVDLRHGGATTPPYTVIAVLPIIEAKAYHHLKPRAEQLEVDEFMREVANLQQQLNELQDGLHSD